MDFYYNIIIYNNLFKNFNFNVWAFSYEINEDL